MIKVVNKLVSENHHSAARAYSDFGLEQTREINRRNIKWLRRQSFSDTAPSPEYGSLEVSGIFYGNYDRLEWDLRFRDSVDNHLFDPGHPLKALADGLLHLHIGQPWRHPSIESHHSKPDLFDTADYIHVAVTNGKKGWMSQGLFPINTHIETRLDDSSMNRGEQPKYNSFAVYTDIRRDAKAGFRAAMEWAKFRTMAVASKDYIVDRLKKEWSVAKTYEEKQVMRIRTERAVPLMLEFFPNTLLGVKDGLREDYRPGHLEAVAALGLIVPGVPINSIKGFPIKIVHVPGKKDCYDAIIPFEISVGGSEKNETGRVVLEQELQKYFNVLMNSPSNMRFNFHLKDAHLVQQQIIEGKGKTALHKYFEAVISAASEVSDLNSSWEHHHVPVLRAAYEGMIESGKKSHFGRISQALIISTPVRNFHRGN